jgi:hypothetical protein
MPNVAAWLLRRDLPDAARPYRAPRGMIVLGLVASVIWLPSAVLGFQQFGLPTVLFGLALAYSGAALYVWRFAEAAKERRERRSEHQREVFAELLGTGTPSHTTGRTMK